MMIGKYTYHKQEESFEINELVNDIFKKSFTITDNQKFQLPKPEFMFIKSPWKIEELQNLKNNLNETKSKLNNYTFSKWHQHTMQQNKAKDIEWTVRANFKPEFVTQAWCKFHEIISKYPLVSKQNDFKNNIFSSFHLCEAPGAFITCLNHWLKKNIPIVHWKWLAMTLNPYYEGNSNSSMINDDRFIMHTLNHWFFGKDNTGNLMTLENLDALIDKSKVNGKVNLVTADGSVNCIHNPSEQEDIVASLHFCEVVAAINILQTKGNFLLKVFTTFEHKSICLIYFLSCIFKEIHFYKPVTSKEGNSEVYVICLEFKGFEFIKPYLPVLRKNYAEYTSTAMFSINDIPQTFIDQMNLCAQLFKNFQCEAIESNIRAYHYNSTYFKNNNFQVKKISKLVADKYLQEFPLEHLHIDLQIVGNLKLKRTINDNWIIRPPVESFNERQHNQLLKPVYRLLMYKKSLQFSDQILNSFVVRQTNNCFEINLILGKPYEYIQSSRFCPMHISEIYKLLFETAEMKTDKQFHLPFKKCVSEYISKMQENFWDNSFKFIQFQYNEIYNNSQIVNQIKQILINLLEGDSLVLFGFLLLTQFNVGLICVLAQMFESVEFSIDEQIGGLVIFKSFTNNSDIFKNIEYIEDSVQTARKSNSQVLSIISITDIYGSPFYSVIKNMNMLIAKYAINCIDSMYKE